MKKVLYFLSFCLFLNGLQAQSGIQGTITDDSGAGLISATLQIVGDASKRGVQTDLNGKYQLALPEGIYTIEASFIGFASQKLERVKVEKGKFTLCNFVLKNASELSEVVVVGRKVERRSMDRSSAPTTITSKAIAVIPKKSRGISTPTGKAGARPVTPTAAAPTAPPPPPPPASTTYSTMITGAASGTSVTSTTVIGSTTSTVGGDYTWDGKTVVSETAKPAEPAMDKAFDSKMEPKEVFTPLETKKMFEEKSTAKEEKASKIKAEAEKAKMPVKPTDEAEDAIPDEPEQKAGQLTAGEWSDLKNWDFWLRSLDTAFGTYHKNWQFNFDNRYSVQVVGNENQPIADAKVGLYTADGKNVWEARTDNQGKAELWSGLFGEKYYNLVFKVALGGKTFDFKNAKTFKTSVNTLKIPASCSHLMGLDIAFVVDATGSMGDEIAYLKSEVVDVIRRVKMNNQALQIRTASVFYRDFTDEYVTRIFPFGKSLKQNLNFIRNQSANGGGDFEEAVPEGLESAIDSLQWSENALARIMFLILDAPPHLEAKNIEKLHVLMQKAALKGIRIIPITASGIDKNVEYLMKTLGVTTGGTYVFLTDDSGIGGGHIKATTEKHEVEHLNDLMVRLIRDATDVDACRRLAEKTAASEVDLGTFQLTPIPASTVIYIEMKKEVESLRITNVHGQVMEDFYDVKVGTKEIAVNTWASGVYYATSKQDGKVSTKKFSIIR